MWVQCAAATQQRVSSARSDCRILTLGLELDVGSSLGSLAFFCFFFLVFVQVSKKNREKGIVHVTRAYERVVAISLPYSEHSSYSELVGREKRYLVFFHFRFPDWLRRALSAQGRHTNCTQYWSLKRGAETNPQLCILLTKLPRQYDSSSFLFIRTLT